MQLIKRFPIRLKIMLVLLSCITLVVSLITFTMANFFHDDKQAYVNDWTSIAALTTADECRGLLVGYAGRLRSYARVLREPGLSEAEKTELMQGFFEDFPQLVALTLTRDGEEIESAIDHVTLENAGLELDDLERFRADNPLPVESILDGRVDVRNASMAEALPVFALSFKPETVETEAPVVLTALIHLEELLRLGAKFKVFEVILADADGTVLAHPDLTQVTGRAAAELIADAELVHTGNRAGMTLEYSRNGEDVIGGFASVPFGDLTVAAHVGKSAAYLASRDLLVRLTWVSLILLVLFAVGGRLWAQRITRPMERLSRATRKIAKGSFDIKVDIGSKDEIGDLAGSFNEMAGELKGREEQLEEAHAQLIHSEKLAAFGQLGAGIAHEVKNPLTGIFGCAQLALMEAPEGSRLKKNVEIIKKETERCRHIIESLLKFARQEKALLEPTKLNDVVRESAEIINHQMEINDVKVHVELEEPLPRVHANANQLQQVLMNLMLNAQQAMGEEEGTITLRTERTDSGNVAIVVRDSGPGIPEEIQEKLFEPFFTTKPSGKGTGLGLSVSFGIVKDHGGTITVDSRPGDGAAFTISLPVLKGEEAPALVHA